MNSHDQIVHDFETEIQEQLHYFKDHSHDELIFGNNFKFFSLLYLLLMYWRINLGCEWVLFKYQTKLRWMVLMSYVQLTIYRVYLCSLYLQIYVDFIWIL
jgi:hypothetical protein